MIIIEENTLIHVDSSSDVIEHYGVKGMKWGVRKARDVAKKVGQFHRNNLEYKYYKKYGDMEIAKQKADKRYKIDKAVAGAAIAAGTAYGAYKLGKYVRDEHIGQNLKGRTIATMTIGDLDNDKEFFAAQGGDINRYRRNWGPRLQKVNQKWGGDKRITQNFNKVTGDAKIAPNREAYKALKKVANGKKKVTRKTYDNFVKGYKGYSPELRSAFQKELKKRGYSGIIDINDAGGKTEVFARNSPVIMFDGKKNIKRVATKTYNGNTKKDSYMRIVDAAPELTKTAITVGGSLGAVNYLDNANNRVLDKEYKKKRRQSQKKGK